MKIIPAVPAVVLCVACDLPLPPASAQSHHSVRGVRVVGALYTVTPTERPMGGLIGRGALHPYDEAYCWRCFLRDLEWPQFLTREEAIKIIDDIFPVLTPKVKQENG